eukprot:NODE_4695_length_753_cov_11.188498_g4535_i0.p1 GENE.NODE_4695_length_753_cov_11.188498_g4535_i0~~NODE_4695_length_753_cov_11.188498_g4535_i0.p1  ORF type:complete len:224 (+),score=61.25 NODE_4695_length_753_cov_11.188498_g4535_i0:101-673(+)
MTRDMPMLLSDASIDDVILLLSGPPVNSYPLVLAENDGYTLIGTVKTTSLRMAMKAHNTPTLDLQQKGAFQFYAQLYLSTEGRLKNTEETDQTPQCSPRGERLRSEDRTGEELLPIQALVNADHRIPFQVPPLEVHPFTPLPTVQYLLTVLGASSLYVTHKGQLHGSVTKRDIATFLHATAADLAVSRDR